MSAAHLLLTAFGLGHLRPASGTWGSTPPPALALVTLLAVGAHLDSMRWIVDAVLVVLLVVFSVACVRYGPWAEERFGRKDPGQVVADEVAGQALTLLALPWRPMVDFDAAKWNVMLAAIGFVAFRLLDIVKPPPANGLQRLRAGWGILVDDLIAGVYAMIGVQVIVRMVLV